MFTPLYGHVSPETAYVVDDYPYGRLRCTIKFWLESHATKGARFCSQTINPKNGRVNAPKMSTYAKLGGCMYLDDKGHCVWRSLSEYADAGEILKFVQDFPQAEVPVLRDFLKLKMVLWRKRVSGAVKLGFTINGEVQQTTPEEDAAEHGRLVKELCLLEQAHKLLFGGA